MALAYQACLLDADLLDTSLLHGAQEPAPRPLDGILRRTLLDPGIDPSIDPSIDPGIGPGSDPGAAGAAWVDVRPGWVGGADLLFERLVAGVPWRAERRRMYERIVDVPRLVCFYGEADPLPDPALVATRDTLSAHYAAELGEPFRTAGMCLYRNGSDSVAWHGDTIGRGSTHDTMVAIVSLGAPRSLVLRPRGGGRSVRFELGHGDLVVMGGSCQRTWEHAVPKTRRPVGPRVSVQFRPRGVC